VIALLLASALVLPPDGTYSYALEAGGKTQLTSQVVFVRTSSGLTVREHTDIQGGIATTRTFDSALAELDYAAQTTRGDATVALSPGKAAFTFGGATENFPLPAGPPVMVIDGLFAPAAIIPAMVAATHVSAFTAFTTRQPQALEVQVQPGTQLARPEGVPAGDVALTLVLAGGAQTLWYDPATNVLDEFDPDAGTRVRLIARSSGVTTFAAPPTPTPLPSTFPARNVTFLSRDGSAIAATISYPKNSAKRLPGFVLVAGSGAHDRDEAIGNFHVLFDVAAGLNAHGYAVLRYDKRFVGSTTSRTAVNAVTRQSYVDDVVAAVKALRADPRVDAGRIYLLGHSEGGELVLAAQLQGVHARAIALLAPASLPYVTALENQVQRGMATQGQIDQMIAANATFFASWKDVDPRKEIGEIGVPMLVVHGSDDVNVTDSELAQLTAAAQRAHRNLKIVTLSGDDHLYSSAHQRFDPRVVEAIAAWLASLR